MRLWQHVCRPPVGSVGLFKIFFSFSQKYSKNAGDFEDGIDYRQVIELTTILLLKVQPVF